MKINLKLLANGRMLLTGNLTAVITQISLLAG